MAPGNSDGGRSAEDKIAELDALFEALPTPPEGTPSFRQGVRGIGRDLYMMRPAAQKAGLTAKRAQTELLNTGSGWVRALNGAPYELLRDAGIPTYVLDATRKNLAAFNQALAMFAPFAAAATPSTAVTPAAKEAPAASDLDELRAQLSDMKRRLDGIVEKT